MLRRILFCHSMSVTTAIAIYIIIMRIFILFIYFDKKWYQKKIQNKMNPFYPWYIYFYTFCNWLVFSYWSHFYWHITWWNCLNLLYNVSLNLFWSWTIFQYFFFLFFFAVFVTILQIYHEIIIGKCQNK